MAIEKIIHLYIYTTMVYIMTIKREDTMARDEVTCQIEMPIGPRGGTQYMYIRARAMVDRPGWYFVNMHADRVHSVDASSRDVLTTIRELRDGWVAELNARYPKEEGR